MKLNIATNPVERGGVQSESTFNINITSQAFEILSSGIYTDPMMAVIRELSCNAYDAHKAAGKSDIPFEIHLPNSLEPWLSIKDVGTGLSDEEIFEMYTTYFESTKNDSNEEIGGFGLGSKSPFAYCDAFEVISCYNGTKSTYSIFKNEENIPTVARLAQNHTDEPNGLEVKIAIRKEDFYQVGRKTAEILRFFPVKPIVKGGQGNFVFDEPYSNDALILDGYAIAKQRYGVRSIIVVGNVPYTVDFSECAKSLFKAEQKFIQDYSIVAHVDIGDVDIAVSREEIRYTKHSINKLSRCVIDARLAFLKHIDDVAKAASEKPKYKWNNYKKFDKLTKLMSFNFSAIVADYQFSTPLFKEWFESDGTIGFTRLSYHNIGIYKARKNKAKIDLDLNRVDPSIRCHNIFSIVLNDVRVRAFIRLNNYIHNNASNVIGDGVVMITPFSLNKVNNDRVNAGKSKLTPTQYDRLLKKEIARFEKEMGYPKIVKLSNVTKDVKPQSSGSSKTSGQTRSAGITFRRFNQHHSSIRYNVKPKFVECSTTPSSGLYVQIDPLLKSIIIDSDGTKGSWSHNYAKRYFGGMLAIINHVNGTKYTLDDIYGLTTRVIKHVSTYANWYDLVDLFTKSYKQIKDLVSFQSRLEHTDNFSGLRSCITNDRFINFAKTLDSNSDFRKTFLVAVDQYNKFKEGPKSAIKLIGYICSEFNIKQLDVSQTPLFTKQDFAKYKMFNLINLHNIDSMYYPQLKEYIEMVDNNV